MDLIIYLGNHNIVWVICLDQKVLNSDLGYMSKHAKSPYFKKFEGRSRQEKSKPDLYVE